MSWVIAGSEAWPAPWAFFGPVMMVVFVVACIAVIGFMLRRGPTARRESDGHSR